MQMRYPEIKTEEDLLPPGAAPGEVPTDLDQATGLERLEILGKMQGVDVFDMKPLDASRKGRSAISRRGRPSRPDLAHRNWEGEANVKSQVQWRTPLLLRLSAMSSTRVAPASQPTRTSLFGSQ